MPQTSTPPLTPLAPPAPRVGVDRLCWVLVGVGMAIRVGFYLHRRSLWVDEASLALNFTGGGWGRLLRPLSEMQTAPWGFLALTELAVRGFGPGELAFRLLPLVAGCVAVVVLAWLYRRTLHSPAAVLVAVTVAAVGQPLVYYSVEFKPYALDLLAGAVLTLLAVRVPDHTSEHRAWWRASAVLGAASAAAVMLSSPSVFAIAGLTLVLAGREAARRRWRRVVGIVACTVPAAAVFCAHFALVLNHAAGDEEFRHVWRREFVPLGVTPAALAWHVHHLADVFEGITGIRPPLVGAGVAASGFGLLLRRQPALAALGVAPLAVTLAASAAGLYPVSSRLLLLASPGVILLAAAPLDDLSRLPQPRVRPVAVALLAALLLIRPVGWLPTGRTGRLAANEELRPVLRHVAQRLRPGDGVYVYYGGRSAFRYYTHPRGGDIRLPDARIVIGRYVSNDLPAMRGDVEGLPEGRVWLLYSHPRRAGGKEFEPRMLAAMLARRGRLLDEHHRRGAGAWLYRVQR